LKFDDRFLDEIKGRLRLSDVIGRTVKLRRQGREYAGLSPFAKEKTPSFFVNDDKGFYHDFSSGKHGDLISFLQETERLTFREAVERLAAEAGLALPAEDPRQAEVEHRRQGLLDWIELAAKWFEAQLSRPAGDSARDYLEGRGLPQDQWGRFRLGFAPSGRTGLKDYLIAKGAHPAELIDAGLLIAPEDGGPGYDRFRDRIIFPITDGRGRVVSFGGRAIDPDARAKYLNGPETTVFSKGALLYGLHEARRLLHAGERGGADAALVVVEGYMDVIACQRADIAAVAAMGTALTEDQMAALWRLHPEPTLCFDGDKAGKRAAHRSLDRALPLLKPGQSFKFAIVTGGKDPDDVLRDQGAAALKEQLSQTKPFVQFLFERERDFEPLDTPERRADFKVRLRRYSSLIQDKDLSEFYRAELIDLFYDYLRRTRVKFSGGGGKGFDMVVFFPHKNTAEILKQRIRTFLAAVVIGAIENPQWIAPHVEFITHYGFGDNQLNLLIQPIVDSVFDGRQDEVTVMMNIKSDGGNVLGAFDTALRFAKEVDVYPFVNRKASPAFGENFWNASFERLMLLVSAEAELAERRKDKESKQPVPEGHTAFVGRGRELNEILRIAKAEINEGTVWGRFV
jgi:DNA primase